LGGSPHSAPHVPESVAASRWRDARGVHALPAAQWKRVGFQAA